MSVKAETIDITVAVARAKGEDFTIEPARLRAPQGDEVRVQILATGLCHTDLIVRDQYYPVPLPAVLGHEGAGVVESVGPQVADLKPGDHVVLSYGACGRCDQCRSGFGGYCKDFFGLNFGGADLAGNTAITDPEGGPLHDHFFAQSSFATYALARENNAVKVGRDAPLELLGPLGCGIQTGAGAVINSLPVGPGGSFTSFGAGAVGLSAVMAARVAGATTIVAVDVVGSRLELALELGATHVVNSRDTDPIAAIREITGGGTSSALESTGRPEVLAQGIEALGPRGAMGVVGAPPLGTAAQFDVNNLLLGGRTIRGIGRGRQRPTTVHPAVGGAAPAGTLPVRQARHLLPARRDQPGSP